MADTVTSQVLLSGARQHVVALTGISDGTGETAVAKIDKSTLKDINGNEPSALTIQKVQWTTQGFTYLKLAFDHATDDAAVVLAGDGCLDFSGYGGLKDPASAGGTGDLLLTSVGAAAGDTYTVVLDVTF